jgi:hypothetical protein
VRLKTIMVAVVCAVGPGAALGGYAGLGDARAYQETCTAGLNRPPEPGPEGAEAWTACLGYTAGVIAGYGAGWPAGATGALALAGEVDPAAYERLRLTDTHCFPGQIAADQVARRVLLRLKYHAEELALPTARLIAAAGCYSR